MKTYSETKGKQPFDWNDFLDKAIKGEITESEFYEACDLSSSWVTCACGNMCDIIPRFKGEPEDYELSCLGDYFSIQIFHEKYEGAKETLKKIEKRSAEIINQIKNGK